MDTLEFATVDRVLMKIKGDETDIDVKLMRDAEVLHLRLEKQLDIKNFMESVAHVDDYKTIRKSVTVLNDKMAKAEKLGVKLDEDVVEKIN